MKQSTCYLTGLKLPHSALEALPLPQTISTLCTTQAHFNTLLDSMPAIVSELSGAQRAEMLCAMLYSFELVHKWNTPYAGAQAGAPTVEQVLTMARLIGKMQHRKLPKFVFSKHLDLVAYLSSLEDLYKQGLKRGAIVVLDADRDTIETYALYARTSEERGVLMYLSRRVYKSMRRDASKEAKEFIRGCISTLVHKSEQDYIGNIKKNYETLLGITRKLGKQASSEEEVQLLMQAERLVLRGVSRADSLYVSIVL